ncbi:hypothetical protein KP77_28650 [Jeotgalibacillus alimentarius]|uniref:DUF2628 domain-containing protein n=1 Tax=Jeotgalibacillus alimentarius TaxID=135826 RepID=A0A0C2VNK0_9BACL|nr:hypothetical protein [Jeotgalibacillus alimentarius]KIL45573.1 hypothetical protein KP77_28650 [Jeotgalibacillus alimentarius]
MKVKLVNNGGVVKVVKVGFSWTTFFFGFFPALFRGDLKWALIMFILEAVLGSFTLGIGAWITGVIFSFKYNNIYIKELIEKGYTPVSQEDKTILQQEDIITRAR